MVTLWGIQMNICLYMFSTFSSAKNIFENRSGFNFFFSRETAARDELINEESLTKHDLTC